MGRRRESEPDPEALEVLAGFSEQFAADGRWDHAIDNARSVLRQYEALADTDPDRFAGRVAEERSRVERLVAEATALGAPTTVAPSPEVVAMVEAAGRLAADPALRDAAAMADRLDGLPDVPNRRLRRAHPSVREAVEHARRVDAGTALGVAEKLARHAVVLRPLGVLDVAHDAALAAAQTYERLGAALLQPRDAGYQAYALLILADGWFSADEIDGAGPTSELAVALFQRHRARLVPANMFDLVRALSILAQCQAKRDAMDEARQSIVDAKAIADAMRREAPGDPGSIAVTPWGLPVVPTEKERKSFYG